MLTCWSRVDYGDRAGLPNFHFYKSFPTAYQLIVSNATLHTSDKGKSTHGDISGITKMINF